MATSSRFFKWLFRFSCRWIVLSLFLQTVRADNLALLSGTLRTIQRAACDGEMLSLRCPLGTAVSIQLAQYGRPSPGISLCPGQDPSSTDPSTKSPSHQQQQNDSCALTPSMQHALLQTVVEACTNKRHCKFPTSVKTVEAHICANQTKFVEVAYKCRPLEFRSKIICENESLLMKCKRNARLAIYSASFGRVHSQSIQCPQPDGVDEETCEASFSTETVMQSCHGKRRCSLMASTSVFTNVCGPRSRPYLRVVYTCVSRRILKEHYQGELESDESENNLDDEEDSFETEDYSEPVQVTTTTATPSPHQVVDDGYLFKNLQPTGRPDYKRTGFLGHGKKGQAGTHAVDSTDLKSGSNGPVDIDMLGDISGDATGLRNREIDSSQANQDDRGRVIGFISEWITSVSFIKANQEKFILYLTLSIAAGILVFLSLLIGRLWWQKRRARAENKLQSVDPIPAFADDVSDIDNDIDLTLVPPPPLAELTNLGPIPTSDGVRYSVRCSTLRCQDSDTNPRSFNRNGSNHYYYG